MLDSIYHINKELLCFCIKMLRFWHIYKRLFVDAITRCYEICKPLVVYQF